jgi:glycosyltransferase involved in cell wall biosynthesis
MTNPRRVEPGLTSVIVPCLGRLEITRRCVSALLQHTRRPWELIAVTRSTSDATAAYLQGIRDAAQCRVELVTNTELRSVRTAWHRGLSAGRGDFIALIGPSVIVTDAWLDQLIALAGSDPAMGMVGPMSNGAMAPQRVEEIPYADPTSGLNEFATRWRSEHRGRWMTVETLSGQCLLLKRGVLEASGSRRKIRPAGCRPNRLSLRVKRAGFRLGVANDLFVHQDDGRPGKALEKNSAVNENSPESTKLRTCRVSLTMIVRNEEANLAACLESASGLFDEIVIVDTGSTDRTVEIAQSFGARVFDFVWVDDFAAARNAGLARATGDYAFWLDADDRVEPAHHERLRALFDGLRTTSAAYVVRCSCDADPSGGGATIVDHIRLFPVRADVRWAYRVHEQILPALRRVGVEVRWTDAAVRHVGYNDPALRQRKLQRDQAILESELADRPDDPFVLFNLGAIAVEANEPRAALGFLQRSLAGSAPTDSITRKLYVLIARCHQLLGEPEAALAACGAGLAIDDNDAELWFRKAVLHRRGGDARKAEECWRKVLTLDRPERFSSVDEGIYGQLTRRNLAALAEERRDRAEAALQWAAVLAECPDDAEATTALTKLSQPQALVGGLKA